MEQEKAQGTLRAVGVGFLRRFEILVAAVPGQRQECRAQQGQRTGRVGVAQPAAIFAALDVAPPMYFVLHAPVGANLFGHSWCAAFFGPQAQGKVAGAGPDLTVAFVGALALQAGQLGDMGEGRRIGFQTYQPGGPLMDISAGGLALDKRGAVPSSWRCASAWSVGWLSLRAAI